MVNINRDKLKKAIITFVILIMLCCVWKGISGKLSKDRQEGILQILCRSVFTQMEKTYLLLPVFFNEDKACLGGESAIQSIAVKEIPLLGYLRESEKEEETEDEILAEIMKKQEGIDEDVKNIEESRLDYGEDALHIENSMMEEIKKENDKYLEENDEANSGSGTEEGKSENEVPVSEPLQGGFQSAAYPVYAYDWSEQWGYEELVSNFFAVDNTTSLKKEYVNLDNLLYRDLSVDKESEGPQILIYHTHSQEGFVDSVPGDTSTTIVGAGEKLAGILREKYGFNVLHHTGEYDVENRDNAYNDSLPAIEQILAENPTIEVVIDLHRDEMKEGKKLVIDLQGRPTARFMFFNGMSYIRDKGDISYLENPYIQDNLALSFQAQVAANEYYPGIARRIYLKAYRYNMHLCPKSMLIELGAQTNTVEEIMNACDPLAHIIAIVLNG